MVRNFRISGAKAVAETDLLALLQEAVGRALTLADLQVLADRVTGSYRQRGYLLARAYIPAQEIRDGTVEIAVLEGRLGRLRVINHSVVSDSTVERHLTRVQAGAALQDSALERELLLLNDLPGVDVKSTLTPGASVGTTDLDVEVRNAGQLAGSIVLDNYGNRFTGDVRAGANLVVNNPAGMGDALSLYGLTGGKGLGYVRAAYQVPVSGAGTRVGVAGSEMRYELGEEFASLRARGIARIGTLYVLQPFQRSRRANFSGQLSYDHKRLEDRADATASRKTMDLWTLGLSGDQVDALGGGGLVNYSVSVSVGDLNLDPASATLDRSGYQTQGHFRKAGYRLIRAQHVADRLSLYGQFSGQWAGKNLDSSEKFSLGGPYGVRAYPQGEAPADDAWLATLELHFAFLPDWQLIGFADLARGRRNRSPLPTDAENTRRLAGAGAGLAWSKRADLSLQAHLAWRTAAAPTSDVDRRPRAWIQVVKYF